MFNKIKAIQELRSQANQIKKVLEQEEVEGSGAWGKVKIKIDGNQEIKSVEISEELIGNKSGLESAVKEAVNDGIKKVQKVMASKLSSMKGLNLPGFDK